MRRAENEEIAAGPRGVLHREDAARGDGDCVFQAERPHRQQTRTEVASYCPWARIHKQSFIETTLIL